MPAWEAQDIVLYRGRACSQNIGRSIAAHDSKEFEVRYIISNKV